MKREDTQWTRMWEGTGCGKRVNEPCKNHHLAAEDKSVLLTPGWPWQAEGGERLAVLAPQRLFLHQVHS